VKIETQQDVCSLRYFLLDRRFRLELGVRLQRIERFPPVGVRQSLQSHVRRAGRQQQDMPRGNGRQLRV